MFKIAKSELTRQRIYEASLSLFHEVDYDQATMREIANRAGVALGSAYYYFKSKDDIVMAFYQGLQTRFAKECDAICRDHPDFEGRVLALLAEIFAAFQPSRHFLSVLMRSAGDPKHPLSPFSAATREIREEAIGLFAKCLQGTEVKVAEEFRPHLPKLFWLYQMGLIFFWLHDSSPEQTRTKFLLQKSLKLLLQLMSLSRFPFLGGIRRNVSDLIATILEPGTNSALPQDETNTTIAEPSAEEIHQVTKSLLQDEDKNAGK